MKKGARNVVLSLGEKGSILVTKDRAYKITLDPIKTNLTVGAGDAFIAGFAYSYQNDKDVLNAYMFAHATSYAYVIHRNFHLTDVHEILNQINVEEIHT